MRSVPFLVALVAMLLGSLGFAVPAAGAEPTLGLKVAIIVGPVGEELTPVYISLADAAADAAETRGATIAKAYSPDATAEKVIAAVEGANIVIYLGHGVGTPNPYSETASADTMNGWGLNGPEARGDHSDSFGDGAMAYYGEAWIAANARPAPGWVMIYSNACYAPGASEGHHDPASEETAAERVSAYSRGPLADLGASAYFATDYYEGAAHLVGALLDNPTLAYGDIFASEPNFDPEGLVQRPHGLLDGMEAWLHQSPYFEGKVDYWYAFAGDPTVSLAGGPTTAVSAAEFHTSLRASDGSVTGMASSYPETPGWEGQATIALPAELGGGVLEGEPRWVVVCADRCVAMPVVDVCPCFFGTPDERVANLSHEAWRQISEMPLEEGLIEVRIQLSPKSRPPWPPRS